MTLYDNIQQTTDYVRSRIGAKPEAAVILGSGLGPMADELQDPICIPYEEIPNFPISTVHGHSGQLIAGNIGSRRVLAMQGRFHLYEGYSEEQCTFPVRVFRALDIPALIVTNASGGINRLFQVGDLMLIEDIANFSFRNPLRGAADERLGPRFPDMSCPFSPRLVELAEQCGTDLGIKTQKGTYIAVTGPNYETPAELRMFSRLGIDAVGMSTVQEVLVAKQGGIPEVLGISVITDMATGEPNLKVSHEEVIKAARAAEPRFVRLVTEIIVRL
ncbi:MAG: purine-nucleoside phosphorylase [Candidatus Wallbacteria bacterium]|nr:purine-nucleoside phosphorylase [Candidatus Wallbacteria bacterium]